MKMISKLRYCMSKTHIYERLMRNTTFQSLQSITKTLSQILLHKQYLNPYSSKARQFLENTQIYLINVPFQPKAMIDIYKKLNTLELINPKFKFAFFTKAYYHLIEEPQISNNQLEMLLWLMHRQCPYRKHKFEELGNMYTLRLFDMYQYMLELKNIPLYSPYLRISTLIKLLGHQITLRQQIFNLNSLEKLISHKQFVILGSLITKQQSQKQYTKQNLTSPYKHSLLMKTIQIENIYHDQYLLSSENQDANDGRNNDGYQRLYDNLRWPEIMDILKVTIDSTTQEKFDNDLIYNCQQLFWRKIETEDFNLEASIKLFQLLSESPIQNSLRNLVSRAYDSLILNLKNENIKFASGQAMLKLVESLEKLDIISNQNKQNLVIKVSSIICDIIEWEQGEKQQLHRTLSKYKVVNSSALEFLKSG